jgi:hypothetical protein
MVIPQPAKRYVNKGEIEMKGMTTMKTVLIALVALAGMCATAAEPNAVSTAKEPGPMGKIVMAALHAANTGDFATAVSCCKPMGAAKRGVTETDKLMWGSTTEHGQLDFSEGKTYEKKEREAGEGKGIVFIHLASSTKDELGTRTFNMIKVNGEWKIDE